MNNGTRRALVSFLEKLYDQDCIQHDWADIEFLECGENGEPSILQTCIHCGEEREKSASLLVEIVERTLKQAKITLKK